MDAEVTMARGFWGATLRGSQQATRTKITRLPSDTTFRCILQKLDFQALAQQFEQWANTNLTPEPGEWVAMNGKSIKGTVTEPRTAYQNFVNMVSLCSSPCRTTV